MGIWGGSEAALLLGATYPDLVYGVAALAPSNALNCSNPCAGASWTLDGQAVPHTNLGQPNPTDAPGAVIPLERIRGPVLTLCGGADALSYSCDYADAVAARLQGGGQTQPHRFLTYPDAGHGVGTLLPYQPARPMPSMEGKTPAANWTAREQAWPLVLDFLGDPK
jgi:pimeloyl-ACP methyl ester carboxylesterase